MITICCENYSRYMEGAIKEEQPTRPRPPGLGRLPERGESWLKFYGISKLPGWRGEGSDKCTGLSFHGL